MGWNKSGQSCNRTSASSGNQELVCQSHGTCHGWTTGGGTHAGQNLQKWKRYSREPAAGRCPWTLSKVRGTSFW